MKQKHNNRIQRTSPKKSKPSAVHTLQTPFKPLLIWGKNVVESFFAKQNLQKASSLKFSKAKTPYLLHILADESSKVPAQLTFLHETAKQKGIKTIIHRNKQSWPLYDMHDSVVHQRICLQVPEYPTEDIAIAHQILEAQNEKKQFSCAGLVLDQIQDPRNFGAILRSAAFFGVKFVIYAKNRQADLSPLVLKASAGGAFDVQLIPVININRALEELKQSGAWILGTANSKDAVLLTDLPKDRVWVAVLGNEETGLRPDVLKNCDFVTKISGGTKTLDSLNVSVATGILLQNLQSHTLCLD